MCRRRDVTGFLIWIAGPRLGPLRPWMEALGRNVVRRADICIGVFDTGDIHLRLNADQRLGGSSIRSSFLARERITAQVTEASGEWIRKYLAHPPGRISDFARAQHDFQDKPREGEKQFSQVRGEHVVKKGS